MPAALDVDREAVRTLVVAVGAREAARQMGIPEPTVQAWSARGKWFDQKRSVQAIATERKSVQPSATKPADALANVLESHSRETRLGLSKAALAGANAFGKKDGDAVIEQSQQLRHIVAAASTLHGWEDRQAPGVQINVLAAGGMMQ